MVRKGYKVEILRYKISERERFERMRGNMKKWRQHIKNGGNMTKRGPTCG